MTRLLYLILGIAATVTGMVGVILPLLPTTPFLLVAAYCFSRSNPAWEQRMLAHPTLGPLLRAWRERGAIPRKGKFAAVLMMGLSLAMAMYRLAAVLWIPFGVLLLAVTAWIWSRPDQ